MTLLDLFDGVEQVTWRRHSLFGGFQVSWLRDRRASSEGGSWNTYHFDFRRRGWRYLRFRIGRYDAGDSTNRSLECSTGRAA